MKEVRTMKECLRHYVSSLPPRASKNVTETRRPMKEFCGVDIRTVERWMFNGKLPVGEPLVRLRFFLEIMGYKVAELKRMPEELYKLGEMIAYDAISIEAAMTAMGFVNMQSIYRLALGKSGTTKDRITTIHEMREACKNAIAAKRAEWNNKLGTNGQQEAPVAEKSHQLAFGRGSELEVTGYLILAMLPLAEKIVSDDFSADDRRNLREMTGGDAVFRLSNVLEALCGEKARERVLSNSQPQATRNGDQR